LDVSGVIRTNNSIQSPKYDFSYSSIPSFTSTSLGYTITGTFDNSFNTNSATIHSIPFTNLSIGKYLIQSYALFSFTTTQITNIKLGLTTLAASIPSVNDYTNQLIPVVTNQTQSISYSYYLTNNSTATYYINLTKGSGFTTFTKTTFTATFIRIA
jgi:hypothetical protein